MSSSTIRRGPRASDHFTNCHNLMFRSGKLLTPSEVLVLGNVLSHEQGWETNAERIAGQVGLCTSTVKTALAGLVRKHFVVWGQDRNPDGTVCNGWYFVTDTRFQLMQSGITDEDMIAAAVRTTLDAWLDENRRSEPGCKNSPPDKPDTEISDDNSGSPEPQVSAVPHGVPAGQNQGVKTRLPENPVTGESRPKKTTEQESQGLEHQGENQRGVLSPVGAPRERAHEEPPRPESRTEEPPAPPTSAPPPSLPQYDPANPRCKQHRHIPLDDPGPPCGACRDAKRWQADKTAASAAAEARQVRECPTCDAAGTRYDTRHGRVPLTPYRRCDHATPLEVLLAEIAEQDELLERRRSQAGRQQEHSSAEVRRQALAAFSAQSFSKIPSRSELDELQDQPQNRQEEMGVPA